MAIKYKPGGVTVTIGKSQDVSLPTRVFRGRATCMHFDTDKSFLLPPSVTGVRNIVAFFNRHPGTNMLVNGHTDLVGDAQYNLQLSNERVAAVAAYLVNNVDDWLAWYSAPIQSKRWSYREDQNMLATVTDSSGAPYYTGPITGFNDAATQDAAKRFQGDNGLKADGQLGSDTRRALIAKYMALEGTSLPGATPMVKHGCGKFHPVDATTAADEGNRRVEIFLFEGAVDPAPQDPCPSPGCTQYPQWVGNPEEDLDLCKPIEAAVRIRLFDRDANPLAGAPFRVMTGQTPDRGVADSQGFVTLLDVSVPASVVVRWNVPDQIKIDRGGTPYSDPDRFDFEKEVFVDADTRPRPDQTEAMLANLGYDRKPTLSDNVRVFQHDYSLTENGDPNDPVMLAALKERHDNHDPQPVAAVKDRSINSSGEGV